MLINYIRAALLRGRFSTNLRVHRAGISQPISLEQELQEAFAFFSPENLDIDAQLGVVSFVFLASSCFFRPLEHDQHSAGFALPWQNLSLSEPANVH